jgi:proton-translocating NAD(P)+ transhydrogenase subunit alpha
VAVDASHMYSRNLTAFIARITDDEAGLVIDLTDEIVSGACITHDGHVTHPVTRHGLGTEAKT